MEKYAGEDQIKGLDKFALIFSAGWCKNCKKVKKIVAPILESSGGKMFEVDADEHEEEAAKFEIRALPTIVMLSGGVEKDRVIGSKEDKVLDQVSSFFLEGGLEEGAAAKKINMDDEDDKGRLVGGSSERFLEAGSKRARVEEVEGAKSVMEGSKLARMVEDVFGPVLTFDGRRFRPSMLTTVDELLRAELSRGWTEKDLEGMLEYREPNLTEEGTCATGLKEEPFVLVEGWRTRGGGGWWRDDGDILRISRCRAVVRFLADVLGAEWVGVYRVESSTNALRKLAYVGSPSRAEFPLSAAFAAHSNNSHVGRTGDAVVYWDVDAAKSADAPYYECDSRVKFELCAPITDPTRPAPIAEAAPGVKGIIDLEAWRPNHLTKEGVAFVLQVCQKIAKIL